MDLSFYMLGCLCYTLGMGEEFDSGTIPLLFEKMYSQKRKASVNNFR